MYETFKHIVNNSSFVSGVVMMCMNMGSKYLADEIPEGMNKFFSHPFIRKVTIFCIAFVATRDFEMALIITLLFLLFSKYLMNEKSNSCLPSIKNLIPLKRKISV